MRYVTMTIEVKIPYSEYKTVRHNNRAVSQIKNRTLEVIRDGVGCLSLEVEEDKEWGGFYDDCTKPCTVKLKKLDVVMKKKKRIS
jgi:hypothetical protein